MPEEFCGTPELHLTLKAICEELRLITKGRHDIQCVSIPVPQLRRWLYTIEKREADLDKFFEGAQNGPPAK